MKRNRNLYKTFQFRRFVQLEFFRWSTAQSRLRSTDLIRIINFQDCFGARGLLLARKLLPSQVLKPSWPRTKVGICSPARIRINQSPACSPNEKQVTNNREFCSTSLKTWQRDLRVLIKHRYNELSLIIISFPLSKDNKNTAVRNFI